MRVATRCRKARSCVTKTTAPRYSARNDSSHIIASMSRWFVGSSSSSRSGCATSARASSTRRRHPPESGRHDRVGRKVQPLDHHVDADVDVPVFDMCVVFESLSHDLAHRAICRERHVLFETRDAQSRLAPHRARVRNDLAADDLQQRRLARAVAADDAHALSRLDQQTRVVQEREMAVSHR